MSIRKKDGTIYKLTSPNPVMESQFPWDRSKIVLLNMRCDSEEAIEDKNSLISQLKEKTFDIGDVLPQRDQNISAKQFVEEIKSSQREITPEPIPEPPPEPTPKSTKLELIPDKIRRAIIKFHCVPARTEDNSVVYAAKFIFEGIMLSRDDLFVRFWANTKLNENSIVYPQIVEKRWWKIKGIENSKTGYLYYAVISDLNPDFS